MDAHELMAAVGVVAADARVIDVYGRIAALGCSPLPLLIRGPTGSGKERAARAAHVASRRAGAFVAENCAALSDTLLEAEFFGHEAGAFTGAAKARKGLFEQADGGTLFLDEIGELPLSLQAKLLRVLQEGEVRRVGGDQAMKLDVRVVAATNRDLRAEVAAGRFREDLYHRLGEGVELPALDDRDDLAVVADDRLAARWQAQGREGEPPALGRDVIAALGAREWPGGVRELERVLDTALALRDSGRLRAADVSPTGNRSDRKPVGSPDREPVRTRTGSRSAEALIAKAKLAVAEAGLTQTELARVCFGNSRDGAQRFARKPTLAAALKVLLALGYEITATPGTGNA